jgi:dihydrofolate synthase/folylpolyglutamate synthase
LIKTVKDVEQALLARMPEHQLRPRLEPTARAASLLGDPQKLYRIIHVTGTNGKTSTTRMIERLLREHSLRTGRFTSPHLTKLNERIAIDGDSVSDEVLVEIWNDIEPILKLVDAELDAEGEAPLTYFEALTLLAFSIFADAPVDVLVLEVGMGGEWDSTNVADGDVAVFTPIAIDHADRLGHTVSEIAKTKAGIIKPGAVVVSAKQTPEAMIQLQSKAKETAERLVSYGTDFEAFNVIPELKGQRFSLRSLAGEYTDLFMPLYGEHQVENAALAVAAVEAFLGNGERRILDDIVRVALVDVSSPGRLQVVSREPLTIVDGAHNPHGARSLAKALKSSFGSPRAIGVVGILAGKNVDEMLETLSASFERVIITASNSERSVDKEELATLAAKYWSEDSVAVASSVTKAMQEARELAASEGFEAIVITGSLSVVGEALVTVQEENNED